MNYYYLSIPGYSILVAAMVTSVRYNKLLPGYRAFVWYTWLASLNEIISTTLIYFFRTNTVSANIYVLFESLLLVTCFKNWAMDSGQEKRITYCLVGLPLLWITDNLLFNHLGDYNGAFRVVYSAMLVILSIDQVNQLIAFEKGNIMRSSKFMISIAILVFYTYKALLEIFYAYRISTSKQFNNQLFYILIIINLISNIIFVFASLCLPLKQRSSQRC